MPGVYNCPTCGGEFFVESDQMISGTCPYCGKHIGHLDLQPMNLVGCLVMLAGFVMLVSAFLLPNPGALLGEVIGEALAEEAFRRDAQAGGYDPTPPESERQRGGMGPNHLQLLPKKEPERNWWVIIPLAVLGLICSFVGRSLMSRS